MKATTTNQLLKYRLVSGDEEIIKTKTLKELAAHIGCTPMYLYQNRYRDINKDGSWSFNLKGYNYTLLTLNEDEQ